MLALSLEKYEKATILNVEEALHKTGGKLPWNCPTPMSCGYHPAEDITLELYDEGVKLFQELIGILQWSVEIGRLDILLEVSLLSSHLAIPRVGQISQVYHIFGYLKNSPRRRLFMDPDHPNISEGRLIKFDWTDFYKDCNEGISENMPEARGQK